MTQQNYSYNLIHGIANKHKHNKHCIPFVRLTADDQDVKNVTNLSLNTQARVTFVYVIFVTWSTI